MTSSAMAVRGRRPRLTLAVLAASSVAALVLSIAIGAVPIAPIRVVSLIAGHVSPWHVDTATDVEAQIIWEFRLPRALLGFVVGAALAVAGAVLQAVVRNGGFRWSRQR